MTIASIRFQSVLLGCASMMMLIGACADPESSRLRDEAEDESSSIEEARSIGDDTRARFLNSHSVLAFTEDAHGGFAALVEDPDGSGDVGLAIYAAYPNPPLVAPAIAERRPAVEAYFAALDAEAPVPEALRARLSTVGSGLADDVEARERLRLENKSAVESALVFDREGIVAYDATTCTASFRNWAKGVFGGDGTCGQLGNGSFNNTTTSSNYLYATSGGDFELGDLDSGECDDGGYPAASCATVTGNLSYRRQRAYNIHGNSWVGYTGHRQHYGLANCAGNGAVAFDLTRGNSVSADHSVSVGGMLHFYWGTDLPSTRSTIDLMTYGTWNDDQGASGASYVDNRIEWTDNAGSDDKIIVCGDVQQSISMTANDYACGASYSLCTGGGDCDSPCWDIAGY